MYSTSKIRKPTSVAAPLFIVPNASKPNLRQNHSQFSPSVNYRRNTLSTAHQKKGFVWQCSVLDSGINSNNSEELQIPLSEESKEGNPKNTTTKTVGSEIADDAEDELANDSVQLDSLDEMFNDVLSKDWDTLMSFDPANFTAEVKSEDDATKNVNLQHEGGMETANDKNGEKKISVKTKNAESEEQAESVQDPAQEQEYSGNLLKNHNEDDRDDEPRWYFLQVKPGCEQHVAKSIKNLTVALNMEEVRDVFVPTTTVSSVSKGGKRTYKDEKYFPGYILILMAMNRLCYGHIVRVSHVQGFMGDSNREGKKSGPFRCPPPLSDSEMRELYAKLRAEPVDKTSATASAKTEAFPEPSDTASRGGKRADSQVRKERGRTRVNTLLSNSDVNYKQAGTASAADDLAALLADDTDISWDPFADVTSEGKKKTKRKKRTNPNQSFEGDDGQDDSGEFTSANIESNNEEDDLEEVTSADEEVLDDDLRRHEMGPSFYEDGIDYEDIVTYDK